MKFFDEEKNDLLSMLAHSMFIGVFIGAIAAAAALIIMGAGE